MAQLDMPPLERGRAAQVLMHAFDRTGRTEVDAVFKVLREAKLNSALILSVKGQVTVRVGAMAAFRKLAVHAAVWDDGQQCWRARRKGDQV